ncbi:uncharacterized protein H6S33_011441 [Morchella sextelata]|uniref:uncharacterized protein n=1 Tax=Morchella sextelata TaxID=1174677 RepID=UPI001D03A3CB|nr:uncharacterized protein H6S33_011441 [Morchella sextelata]KAH0611014.1 hypothetical protein H6S33_011441 [Morchella sextelata]
MDFPKANMRKNDGSLRSPPYVNGYKQQRSACLKSASTASIIKAQRYPQSRGRNLDSIDISSRVVERTIARLIELLVPNKEECEKARARGDCVFTTKMTDTGSIVEVFFKIDLNGCQYKLAEVGMDTKNNHKLDMPPGAIYIALDLNYKRMFVYFSKGLEMVYGPSIGKWVLDSTTYNIEEYAEIHPPELPQDEHHQEYEKWLLANPHLSWAPWSRAGVYHWGFRPLMELEYTHKDACVARDTYNLPSHIQPVLADLLKSFGNITRAQRILLGVVDRDYRYYCQSIISACPEKRKRFWATDDNQECFSLRTCTVNIPFEPKFDGGDIKVGWAVMVPMGDFRGGDLCIKEMNRRFVYKPGGVCLIRHGRLDFFTANSKGSRYCMVSTVQETLKGEYFDRLWEF